MGIVTHINTKVKRFKENKAKFAYIFLHEFQVG